MRCGRILVGAGVLLLLGIAGGVCYWLAYREQHGAAKPLPIAVVISGDTKGWIVPCGCAANQSGGLLRRASYLRDLAATSQVVYVDAGGSASGTAEYDALKFQAILSGEKSMGLAVHNIGDPEAALGPSELKRLADRTGVAFISANLKDHSGGAQFDPYKIINATDRRIAFIGVTSTKSANKNWKVADPKSSVMEAIRELKGKCDSIIVLAYLPELELRQLAADVPEADIVAGGPTGQAILPTRIGPSLLTAATNKGKFVAELHLAPKGWTGKIVEIRSDIKDDAQQQSNLKAFHQRLAELDLSADKTSFVSALLSSAPAGYQIAGSESCRSCHTNDCTHWATTKHAAAWETLRTREYHFDSYCQQCHTTGYGMPGGFYSVNKSPDRFAVGCESCHGPSKEHVGQPKTRTPFVAKDQCVRCHDHENSPTFAYEKYWPKITHGQKMNPNSIGGAPKGKSP